MSPRGSDGSSPAETASQTPCGTQEAARKVAGCIINRLDVALFPSATLSQADFSCSEDSLLQFGYPEDEPHIYQQITTTTYQLPGHQYQLLILYYHQNHIPTSNPIINTTIMPSLKKEYPWIQEPLIICPPMLPVATGELAAAVSAAGGIGFIGLGNNIDKLDAQLSLAAHHLQTTHAQTSLQTANAAILPVGVGFLNWGVKLEDALPSIKKHVPAAIWLFGAARETMTALYGEWIARVHAETNGLTKVWVQVGSVADALSVMDVSDAHRPDVLVLQGSDAGGHGLKKGAGIITLLPEVHDALAEKNIGIPLVGAGGIADGRGVAAALCLGADGVAMGTRFLACKQTDIMKGYQDELIRASDGGQTTVRTTIYDRLRGYVDWPEEYDGRGMVNQSYVDKQAGMSDEENRRLYEVEKTKGNAGWGVKGRMTSYAGTGVGLVKAVMTAEEIVSQARDEARKVLKLDV